MDQAGGLFDEGQQLYGEQRCYVFGYCVAKDEARGLAVGRESEAAGSCLGQYVVGACCHWGFSIVQDYAEAVRLYHLATAQGHAAARFFSCKFMFGR